MMFVASWDLFIREVVLPSVNWTSDNTTDKTLWVNLKNQKDERMDNAEP